MKNSLWLQTYEKEVTGKRAESNQNKKVILIILPVMLLIFLVAAIANSDFDDPQVKTGILALIGVFAFIIVFAVIMISIGKKKDVAKHTRQNVLGLLKTDEDVDRFDAQMSVAPIKEVSICSETTVFLTEDYVGKRYMLEGNLLYTFIRRDEIASFNRSKTASTTGIPMQAAYFFDIRNANREVIFNGLADSGKQLEALIELLQIAQPQMQVN